MMHILSWLGIFSGDPGRDGHRARS
jgi:hypothetical protein